MSEISKSIYKYELKPRPSAGVQVLDLPAGAQILDCQMVGEQLFFWALVDNSAPAVRRAFVVYPTGGHVPAAPGRHVATVVERGDGNWSPHYLVWHVFEVSA